MADYAVIGKKGVGKSLTCVGIMRDALAKNKRVATNLNINLDHLMHYNSKKTITRLPDHPDVNDLVALGRGQSGVVEEDNGIIVLDECSHILNARAYQDKTRLPILEWLTQSRKHGWDVYYITQGLAQIDRQVRETQLEYVVHIKRTDKWPIPFVTKLTAILFGDDNAIRFPKMRVAITKQGIDKDAFTVGTRFYLAKDLYPCYETQQIFYNSEHPSAPGLHTMLSAWHLKGRYMQRQRTWRDNLELIPQLVIYFACKLCRYPVPLKRGMGLRPHVDGLKRGFQPLISR